MKRKQSILISSWQIFEPKGKGIKVETIIMIDTKLEVDIKMVIGGGKMTTRRIVKNIFH